MSDTVRLTLDRLAAWVGAWALRRLYGECPLEDFDAGCQGCQASVLIRDMDDIARGG